MRKRKRLRWFLVLGVTLIAVRAGLWPVLQSDVARRYLIARLESSFGRPVDVGRFDFSFLDGARLEARSVTVSEDPHFGNDYFLRAESLTAGLRWSALFSGRFEFGTVSLFRPSLNLVRDRDGHWNMEHWLPPVQVPNNQSGSTGRPLTPRNSVPERFYRIDVSGGRINFKQGDDKSGFALLDVSGYVEQNSPALWQLDLEARPMRAGAELQDIGTLRLRGNIGGTSARLQPAELNLTWSDVSLADALRLSRQFDYGMRGTLAVDLSARIAPSVASSGEPSGPARWTISGVARLQGIHSWKLPERPTDPAANLTFEAEWHLGERDARVGKILVEMPNSRLQGSADLNWGQEFRPKLHIETSRLGLEDVLSWYRALRPGVPEDLKLDGTIGVDAALGGWPLQLEQGAFAGIGGTLTGSSLPGVLRIGPINASASRGGLDFAPTEVSFSKIPPEGLVASAADATSANAFTIRGTILPGDSGVFHWPPDWSFSIDGKTPRMQDWLLLAQTLGQPPIAGWTAAGGLSVTLRGVHKMQAPQTLWLGTMDFRGLTASLAALNQPLRVPAAHVEFTQSQRTVTLSGAEAFGTAWGGSMTRKVSGGQWTFDLSADHLDVADLDRWVGPRARPGLLARLAQFGTAASGASSQDAHEAAVAKILARGRLRFAEIALTPLRLDNFDGDIEFAGRTITVRKAAAEFFGGAVTGKFDAQLLADPSYNFQGVFDHVDLARLGHAVPLLDSRISGTASAVVNLSAHGIGRQNLVASMEGDGKLEARNAEMRGLDFSSFIPGGGQNAAPAVFASAKGSFRVKNGGIEDVDFILDNSKQRFQAVGGVDFSHTLGFRIHPLISPTAKVSASLSPTIFSLGGTIEAPLMSLAPSTTPAAQPRPAASAVRR